MAEIATLTYGRTVVCPRGKRLANWQKQQGDEIKPCAGCGESIMARFQDRSLNKSLYGVEEIPAVCDVCGEQIRKDYFDFMLGRSLFCAGLTPRFAQIEVDAPEMIS